MNFILADPIFAEYPDVVIGVVIAHNIDNTQDKAEITQLLRNAEAALAGKFGDTPLIQHPFIAPWREAYRKFGAKPKDYPSSVENLTRRVLKSFPKRTLTFRPSAGIIPLLQQMSSWAYTQLTHRGGTNGYSRCSVFTLQLDRQGTSTVQRTRLLYDRRCALPSAGSGLDHRDRPYLCAKSGRRS